MILKRFNLRIYNAVNYNLRREMYVESKVQMNEKNINAVIVGEGKKSVLLMPGALGSVATDFGPQIEKLPALLPDYTIIAWDPPGYGKSIPPKREFGLDFFQKDADCALNLMKALKREKFSILGWSDGGITGMVVAGKYPENVEKLVIWGANAYISAEEVKILEDIRDVKKWSQRMREPMEAVYGKERFAELWAEWVDAVTAIFKERNGDFCITEVNNIRAPTFILNGKKDPMVAAEHVPYLLKYVKNTKFHEFPDGKHNIHLRYADEFNKLVAEFLQK